MKLRIIYVSIAMLLISCADTNGGKNGMNYSVDALTITDGDVESTDIDWAQGSCDGDPEPFTAAYLAMTLQPDFEFDPLQVAPDVTETLHLVGAQIQYFANGPLYVRGYDANNFQEAIIEDVPVPTIDTVFVQAIEAQNFPIGQIRQTGFYLLTLEQKARLLEAVNTAYLEAEEEIQATIPGTNVNVVGARITYQVTLVFNRGNKSIEEAADVSSLPTLPMDADTILQNFDDFHMFSGDFVVSNFDKC